MKCVLRFFLILCSLSGRAYAADSTSGVLTFFGNRAQGDNTARELVGMTNHINKFDQEKNYIVTSLTPEYNHSLNHTEMAQALWGCYYLQDTDVLKITGTAHGDRLSRDLDAHWFYLPDNYRGSICFKPVIQNIIIPLDLYWAMDTWVRGLFVRVEAPLAYTKWDLNANFTTVETEFTQSGPTILLERAENYFCSNNRAIAPETTYIPLACSKFCSYDCTKNKDKTGLADIRIDIGWQFLLEQEYSCGAFARCVAPTGNKPTSEWLFEPLIGNGHHWEFGVGITGATIMWHNEEGTKGLSFTGEALVTHLCTSHQNRVFDLKDKPLSRYMFAQKTGELTYAPIANLTSCVGKVSYPAQASIIALFTYSHFNWSFDLGYNFWARSQQNFSPACHTKTNECDECGKCIVQKGNLHKWYLPFSDANIHKQGTRPNTQPLTSAEIAYSDIKASSISNKIFTHIDYTWTHHAQLPHLGIGCELEFGHAGSFPANEKSCSSYNKSIAVSQGGVWIKGGATF